jgi:ubiquinone/menaquinone biosynthesis C-methylase UbiE
MSSRQYFDEIAVIWDELRRGYFPQSLRETAIVLANPQPGMTAADLGAGTGFITEGLLEKGLRVIAVDQSPAMLAELELKFPSNKMLECRKGDALNLPIADGEVDCAFANMYLHHVEDPARVVREIGRIVRPGGRVVITDLDEHSHEFLRTEQHDRWLGFKRNDVAAWLHEAGFEKVKVDCAGQCCCSDSCDSSDSAEISIFAASGVKRGWDRDREKDEYRISKGCCS